MLRSRSWFASACILTLAATACTKDKAPEEPVKVVTTYTPLVGARQADVGAAPLGVRLISRGRIVVEQSLGLHVRLCDQAKGALEVLIAPPPVIIVRPGNAPQPPQPPPPPPVAVDSSCKPVNDRLRLFVRTRASLPPGPYLVKLAEKRSPDAASPLAGPARLRPLFDDPDFASGGDQTAANARALDAYGRIDGSVNADAGDRVDWIVMTGNGAHATIKVTVADPPPGTVIAPAPATKPKPKAKPKAPPPKKGAKGKPPPPAAVLEPEPEDPGDLSDGGDVTVEVFEVRKGREPKLLAQLDSGVARSYVVRADDIYVRITGAPLTGERRYTVERSEAVVRTVISLQVVDTYPVSESGSIVLLRAGKAGVGTVVTIKGITGTGKRVAIGDCQIASIDDGVGSCQLDKLMPGGFLGYVGEIGGGGGGGKSGR